MFDLVQELTGWFLNEGLGWTGLVTGVEGYYALGGGLGLERDWVAWGFWRLVAFVVVCVYPHVGDVV